MNDSNQEDPRSTVRTVTVDEVRNGDRLDVTVAALVDGVSRSAAQRLIKAGLVHVDGRKRPQGSRVSSGNVLTVEIPEPDPAARKPSETMDLAIIYEDEYLVAVNKRQGIVVHPGAGHRSGTLADKLLASGRALSVVGGEDRAGLVHRLDRDTSGLVLAAKDDITHEAVASQFKDRTVSKAYLALVLGISKHEEGTIETCFGRRPGDRKRFTGRLDSGRKAVTTYETLMCANLCSLLLVRPKTGRTHQIRVHLSEQGLPVVGDRVYGRAYPKRGSVPKDEAEALHRIKRQALHAWTLRFEHPRTRETLKITAPLPRDMRAVIEAIFGDDWIEEL